MHGIEPVASPKGILRQALDAKIINQNELNIFLDMIDDRNMTSHTYNVELAQEIVVAIPDYFTLMELIAKRLATALKKDET